MPLAEAHTLLGPGSVAHYEAHDLAADRHSLRRLALWCQCFSPFVGVCEPDSLFLDVAGCEPLFGGAYQMAATARQRLQAHGLIVRSAMADTVGAAWALAHHHADAVVVMDRGAQRRVLKTFPIEALRLSVKALGLLHSFGIHRIDQLQQLPRAVLPARFGPEVLQRLDQAFGDLPEPIVPEAAPEPIEACWPFEYPCGDRRPIEAVLEKLLEQILVKLRPRQLGIEQLRCKLHLPGQESPCLTIGLLRASDSPRYVMELIRLQLERLRLPGAITEVSMHAVRVVPLEFRQQQMFDDDGVKRWQELPQLVEVLSSRLGKDAVLRPRLRADAQPELAYDYDPWLEQKFSSRQEVGEEVGQTADRLKPGLQRGPDQASGSLIRPVQLQARPIAIVVMAVVPGGPPLRFGWENRSYVVARAWGPERIETGWWRGHDVRRDYYLVETTTGERFWLYRAENDCWFLHGGFA